LGGLPEHHRRRHQQFRLRARVVGGIGRALGQRDMAGGLDKAAEVRIRHRVAVHPEATHADAVCRLLFRVVVVRTHHERATGNPHGVVIVAFACAHARPACSHIVVHFESLLANVKDAIAPFAGHCVCGLRP
jgi:hypothetical protein